MLRAKARLAAFMAATAMASLASAVAPPADADVLAFQGARSATVGLPAMATSRRTPRHRKTCGVLLWYAS
jgi:hypothetical protein